MSYLWYKRLHSTVDSDHLKIMARKADVSWLLFSGVLGWLFRLASDSSPRGTLPSTNPDDYASLAGDSDAGKVVAYLCKNGLIVESEDGLGHFAGQLEEQAAVLNSQSIVGDACCSGRVSSSLDSVRHYRPTGKELSWMTEGWDAVLTASWSQTGLQTARGVWFRVCCPWIAAEHHDDVTACRKYVNDTIVPAVMREAELSPLKRQATGRIPFTLTNWLDGFRWQDPEYADATWPQTLKEARENALKGRSNDSSKHGRRRKARQPSTAERREGIKGVLNEILADEYGEDAPERVKADLLDDDVAGDAPKGGVESTQKESPDE